MSSNLQSLCHDYVDLKRECEDKTKANKELMKKQRSEREYTFKIKQDLAAANAELTRRAQERNIASSSEHQWKSLYEEIKRDKQEALQKLRDLQDKINDMDRQMKETVMEYEERVKEEQWQRVEMEEKHQAIMIQMEGLIAEQGNAVAHWKVCFSQLAALANGAIDGIPKMLREAEATLIFYNPPKEVENFLEHYKLLVGVMKGMVACARK